HPGAGVAPHRHVVDPPPVSHAVVHDPLAAVASGFPEVLDGQVTDRHVPRGLGKGIEVGMLTVEDRTRRPDERVTVCGDDLAELAGAEGVLARGEPVRRPGPDGPVMREHGATVIACRDDDRSLGRGCGAAPEDRAVAYPDGGRGGARGGECRRPGRGCRWSPGRRIQQRRREPGQPGDPGSYGRKRPAAWAPAELTGVTPPLPGPHRLPFPP